MKLPTEDTLTRWTSKVMFLVAAFGLAYTLGVETTPWLGWFALLLAFGVVALPLTMRELNRIDAARERAKRPAEPYRAVTSMSDLDDSR